MDDARDSRPRAPAAVVRRPRAQVLLSTCNGARFVAQQVDSILAQTDVEVRLLIRDDGSGDATPAILARYAETDARVEVIRGANCGVVASFFELLRASAPDFDLTCFADQDDWWMPAKTARAAAALSSVPAQTPAGYCARVALADAALGRLGDGPRWPRAPAFGNALVENIAIGCTLALNEAGRALLLAPGAVPAARMHDWLAYQVMSACGRMLYDPAVVMLYRQHGANAVGAAANRPARLAATVRRMLDPAGAARIHDQNRELRRLYAAAMPRHAAGLLDAFLDRPRGRLALALDRRIHRQHRLDDVAMRALIAAGRL